MYQLAKSNGFSFLYDNNQVFNLPSVLNFDCLKNAVATFEKHCGKLSDYALKHVRSLAHMCSYQSNESNLAMLNSIPTVCNGASIF